MKEFSKKIILLPVILSVFALMSACAGLGLIKEGEDPLTVYTHESPHFTVKYPNYWVRKPLRTSEVLSVAPTPERRSLPKMSVSVLDLREGFKMTDLSKTLFAQMEEANDLDVAIRTNLKQLGYE